MRIIRYHEGKFLVIYVLNAADPLHIFQVHGHHFACFLCVFFATRSHNGPMINQGLLEITLRKNLLGVTLVDASNGIEMHMSIALTFTKMQKTCAGQCCPPAELASGCRRRYDTQHRCRKSGALPL